jgi:folate-dependent phosphoribosylglycinamide formyltransferase PurN
MYRIGWFSTGRGQGSLNLLNAVMAAINSGRVQAEIGFVFCSRGQGDAAGSDRYIKQVQDHGLPLVCFSSKRFKPELRMQGASDAEALARWRLEYDREVMKRLGSLDVKLSVLAGYMLVMGPEMCKAYDMVNLHPAAPSGPAGTWQEVIWELIATRTAESGNMTHLVIEELDKGPPITYVTFPIRGAGFDPLWEDLDAQLAKKSLMEIAREEGENNPLFAKIRREGALREIPLVVQTVKAFADGRLRLENRRTIADGKPLAGPFCLNASVEEELGLDR